jgi:hypothetical protein
MRGWWRSKAQGYFEQIDPRSRASPVVLKNLTQWE